MSDTIYERPIDAAGQRCTAILTDGPSGGAWMVRVRLPDGRELKVPGVYDTEGGATFAAIQRATEVLKKLTNY